MVSICLASSLGGVDGVGGVGGWVHWQHGFLVDLTQDAIQLVYGYLL